MAIAGPINFTGNLNILKFNGFAFNKELQERSKRLMREAAIAFLNAATERIPRRTTFLRGAFDPLANALGVSGRLGPINTLPRNPEYYYIAKGQRIVKSRQKGADFTSTKSIEQILKTVFPSTLGTTFRFFTKSRPNLTFTYNVQVNYLAVNEDKWKALASGRDAFIAVLNLRAKTVVPQLKEFTVVEKLDIPQGS